MDQNYFNKIQNEERILAVLKNELDEIEDLEKYKKSFYTWTERIVNFFNTDPNLMEARTKYSNQLYRIANLKSEHLKKEAKEHQFTQYEYFRKYIQSLPEYSEWKNAVYRTKGKQCETCGSFNKLEIHHVKSFYSIVRPFQTGYASKKKTEELLWNINNGQVLCKECHDKTGSSMYRKLKQR